MQSASSTASSHQLATTPTTESAFTSASAAYGGGQGGGNDTPPSSPRFNLPDSYWSPSRGDLNAERFARFTRPTGFSELVAHHVAQSRQAQDDFLKAVERHQEDRENDPRSRMQGLAFQINIRPVQVPDFSLSAEAISRLVVLTDPEGEEPRPRSSTSSTSSSAPTAVQQDAAASGCCIPPSCTLL
jgi:hypothetical protein